LFNYGDKRMSSRSQVVTLRMPKALKQRLENEAAVQGVSMNQLTNYLLNIQLTQLETISALENRLEKKEINALRSRVMGILDRVPEQDVDEWDKMD